jgi:hypothetical protein
LSQRDQVRASRAANNKKKIMTEADKTFVPAQPISAPGRSEVVDSFSRSARMAEDRDQLRQAFAQAVQALGFDHFAQQGEGARLLLADLPANWIFRPDPARDIIFTAAARSLSPFLWSDIPRFMTLVAADARALESAPSGLPCRSIPGLSVRRRACRRPVALPAAALS